MGSDSESESVQEITANLDLCLNYQQKILSNVVDQDGLVIMARGLNMLKIIANLLFACQHTKEPSLIILVGADDRDNDIIGECLANLTAVSNVENQGGLTIVNTDTTSVEKRELMYKQGGIFSITSRILVVDMLSKVIDVSKISGIVLVHAERTITTSSEAFIIRIYRQYNKDGFLKAFSDHPEQFTTGFSPLATMMRNLFLSKTFLWPRFHVDVAKSLEGNSMGKVIEIAIPMSDLMTKIQISILSCITTCLSELRKANSTIEMNDWDVDSALHKSFDVIVRRQLDPVWHRVSIKTKQIVSDLSILRQLLTSLVDSDCVSFNQQLDTIIAAEAPPPGSIKQNFSPWLFLDAANTIFNAGRERVYTGTLNESFSQSSIHLVLEQLPKWQHLYDLLKEISIEIHSNHNTHDMNNHVLILSSSHQNCIQLSQFIRYASRKSTDKQPFLLPNLRQYLAWKRNLPRLRQVMQEDRNREQYQTTKDKRKALGNNNNNNNTRSQNKRRRMRGGMASGGGSTRESKQSTPDVEISEIIQIVGDEEEQIDEPDTVPLEFNNDGYEILDMDNCISIMPYNGDLDDQLIEEIMPRFVILYEPDTAFVRRLETYRASHPDRQVTVYFMYYENSVEEKRYLSAVRNEKDAFTKLIKERANMSIVLTSDQNDGLDLEERFLRTVNTRVAGGGRLLAERSRPRIIVDTREFRSSLPSLIHGHQFEVVPCQLTVGDYILTPEICVERKSITDLVSSFRDGRLYTQVETMMLYYENPTLLIEFDHNKSFTLEPFADIYQRSAPVSNDLQSKIALLVLTFPKLKIIWSSSPYNTADIFNDIKINQMEPDVLNAVNIGLTNGKDPNCIFNPISQDLLRSIPGINQLNSRNILYNIYNFKQLSNMKVDELSKFLGNENATKVYKFIHRNIYS